MAKFRLKASLIPKLTERNVISPTTGKIKMRIPWKEFRITGEKCYEIEFLPTDVIETDNAHAADQLAGKRSPKIKTNDAWFISDPTIPWFDQVDDSTPTDVVLSTDGLELLPKRLRGLVHRYTMDNGLTAPSPLENIPSNQTLVQAARLHLVNRHHG
jgi:hypothetical protein